MHLGNRRGSWSFGVCQPRYRGPAGDPLKTRQSVNSLATLMPVRTSMNGALIFVVTPMSATLVPRTLVSVGTSVSGALIFVGTWMSVTLVSQTLVTVGTSVSGALMSVGTSMIATLVSRTLVTGGTLVSGAFDVRQNVDVRHLGTSSLGACRNVGKWNLGVQELSWSPGVLSSLSHLTYSGRRNSKTMINVPNDNSLCYTWLYMGLGRASDNYWGE